MTAKEKLTALADAVREKTGEAGMLSLDAMTALVRGIEAGGLPKGWATGQFNTTSATVNGEFEIEHGLNAVPHVVIVFCENPTPTNYLIHSFFRVNNLEEYVEEEELYYPSITSGRLFYYNSTGKTFVQTSDGGIGMDTDKTIFIPKGTTSTLYLPIFTYRWIAIRLGV